MKWYSFVKGNIWKVMGVAKLCAIQNYLKFSPEPINLLSVETHLTEARRIHRSKLPQAFKSTANMINKIDCFEKYLEGAWSDKSCQDNSRISYDLLQAILPFWCAFVCALRWYQFCDYDDVSLSCLNLKLCRKKLRNHILYEIEIWQVGDEETSWTFLEWISAWRESLEKTWEWNRFRSPALNSTILSYNSQLKYKLKHIRVQP